MRHKIITLLGCVSLSTMAVTARLFEQVIVAVGTNASKLPIFTQEERVVLTQNVLSDLSNVQVKCFAGLLVDFAQKQGAHLIVRGFRVVSDFDYELQLANMNRCMSPTLETIFLIPSEHCSFISAKLIREIAQLGGDVRQFVPTLVADALKKRFK